MSNEPLKLSENWMKARAERGCDNEGVQKRKLLHENKREVEREREPHKRDRKRERKPGHACVTWQRVCRPL